MFKKYVVALCGCVFVWAAGACGGRMKEKEKENAYKAARESMVARQLASRDITDERVLDAFRKVPRHLFVPDSSKSSAYGDFPLPIGEGQTISQPYIVALMTQLLNVSDNSKVLEIGTGSGYQAAILAELAKEVYTIEYLPSLAEGAERILDSLGYDNVYVKAGDGFLGWPENAPFNGIIITCAPEKLPEPLAEQLAIGGRIVVPVGSQYQAQTLSVYTKTDTGLVANYEGGCFFVPMRGMIETE